MDMNTSKRIPPGTPKYHRLTGENHIIIWTLKKKGKSKESLPPLPRCQKRRNPPLLAPRQRGQAFLRQPLRTRSWRR